MLLAAGAKFGLGTPAASAAAAVEAAASATPCMVRLVRYQLAASVPSPATPTIPDNDSARAIAVAPARSPSRPPCRRDNIAMNRRIRSIPDQSGKQAFAVR